MTAPLTNATAIQEHLHQMAERLKGSVLSMGTLQVFGQLGYPHPELGQQSFQVDPRILPMVSAPRPGQTVHVQYETSTAGFGFMTSYIGPYCDGLWRLALPQNIDCHWERRHQRLDVAALFRANLHAAPYHQVIEISEGGFSIAMPPESALIEGAMLQGTLSVRHLTPISVFAKVRRIKESKLGRTAGCSFEDIDTGDRVLIKQLILSELG